MFRQNKRCFSLFFALFIAVSSYVNVFGQEPNIILSARVEENETTKEIIALLENYLRDPFTYPNAYWNSEEQDFLGSGFNLAGNMFQGMSVEDFNAVFDFYVLNLDRISAERYAIQVLVQSKNGLENGSSVWCILKLLVRKEKESFVLENNYLQETSSWQTKKMKYLEFVYPCGSFLSAKDAAAADGFAAELTSIFRSKIRKPLKYYVCTDVNQLGLLQNFSFYFAGYTTGVTKANKLIFSSKGAFHAHELVHLFLPENSNRNYIVEEGLAEFYGTKKQSVEDYRKNQEILVQEITVRNISVRSFFDGSELSFNFNFRYGLGSLICDFVSQELGDNGLRSLAMADTSNERKLLAALTAILAVGEQQFFQDFDGFVRSRN